MAANDRPVTACKSPYTPCVLSMILRISFAEPTWLRTTLLSLDIGPQIAKSFADPLDAVLELQTCQVLIENFHLIICSCQVARSAKTLMRL